MNAHGKEARLSLVGLVVKKGGNLCSTKINRNNDEATVSARHELILGVFPSGNM